MEEHGATTTTITTRTPTWVPVILAFELILAVILLGLSAYIIHGYYFNTLGFVIFLSLLTWIVVIYNFVTLYVPSTKHLRPQLAPLVIDAVMVIFWLSAMGADAALRASFRYGVTVDGCYNDGSNINSEYCVVSRRGIEKRQAVADSTGLSIMSAIAGLSALEMLLFIATLVVGVMAWSKSRSTKTTSTPQVKTEGYRMEPPKQNYTQAPPEQAHVQPEHIQPSYAPYEQHGKQQIHPETQNTTEYQQNLPVY